MSKSPSSTERLGFKLVVIARLYRRVMDDALREYGLTQATALPMRYLAHLNAPIRQGALADILDVEGPTLVRVLDQLVEAGLVLRLEDETDRRAKLVRLTKKGMLLTRQYDGVLQKLRKRLFDGISEKEMTIALRLLDRLEANLAETQAETDEQQLSSPIPEANRRAARKKVPA